MLHRVSPVVSRGSSGAASNDITDEAGTALSVTLSHGLVPDVFNAPLFTRLARPEEGKPATICG